MLDAALIYNFSYTGEHASLLFTLGRAFLALNIIALIALIGYVTILFGKRKNAKSDSTLEWYALLLIAWPIEMLLSSLSGRAYNHYYICWLPVLGLLCAFAFHSYAKSFANVLSTRPIELTYTFLIIVLFIGSSSSLLIYAETLTGWITGEQLPEQIDPVSTYVEQHTELGDKVLAWGAEARINYLTGREAPSAYFLYPLFIPSRVTVPMADRFLEDIRVNPPALIVDAYASTGENEMFYSLDPEVRLQQEMGDRPARVFSAHNIKDVIDFIESNYHHEITIGLTKIYRHNP
jgi:hypothetical protein